MLTLFIYRGYPGSGKSTEARANIAKDGGVMIERDQLRMVLFNKAWGLKRRQEETVTLAQHAIIERAIGHGSNVHVSDTNLNPDTIKPLINLGLRLGVQVKIIDIDTPAIECVKRNHKRHAEGERSVPSKVIWDMQRRYPQPWPLIASLIEDEETKLFSVLVH